MKRERTEREWDALCLYTYKRMNKLGSMFEFWAAVYLVALGVICRQSPNRRQVKSRKYFLRFRDVLGDLETIFEGRGNYA